MNKISFLLLALAAYSSAEDVSSSTEKPFHFLDHEFDRTPVGDAIDRASVKLLKEAYIAAEDKNVVTSPLGVMMLLSMYAAGAGTGVGIRDEIVKALGSPDYDDLFKSYTSLTERFSSMDPNYLTIANKMYIDEHFEVADAFASGPIRSYRSEIEKVKFSDPPSAAASINRWSNEKTKGHIKEAISDKAIDPATISALVNVIFFQGHWNIPFNASETAEKDFYVEKSRTVKKPMMHLEQSLFYHESPELGAKLVELPYKEKGFRMVIVLPDQIDGLPAMLEKVEQRGLMADIFALAPENCDIHLDMPKFEIQSKLELKNILPKVGVSKIFSEPATGIVKGNGLVVDQAFQKAFVKVDEEGATAGAFTGFVMMTMSSLSTPPPPKVFKADHPFLFAILHEEVLLFAGTYTH
ncbi:hypothetical protein O0L34_g12680 [Tuta absoluta]|nr:hypothetical protein O0L34_g12680 [Tuta absoluta]